MAERTERPERPMRPGRKGHRKVCQFCVDKIEYIDYKDVARLRRYMSERAKILPRRVTGTCARHQRDLTTAIKRARQIALVPFVTDYAVDQPPFVRMQGRGWLFLSQLSEGERS